MHRPIKVAVIGVGYLGKFHTEKYANHPQVDLVAVVDTNEATAKEIADKFNTQALTDYKKLAGKIDAVSIVTPTHTHYDIGKFFLNANIHVLMEKPITIKLEEADQLVTLAKKHQLILQVGYLERFNPLIKACEDSIANPLFIESTRIMPFNPRNKDVNVVLDLMIHDIDLIQYLVKSPIEHITANGAKVLTEEIDIANARINFTNGCVANVTASRISLKPERKMRIFQPKQYFSLDLQEKCMTMAHPGSKEMYPGIPEIIQHEETFKQTDALKDEIHSFIKAILTQSPPKVTGEDGAKALKTALDITEMVKSNLSKVQKI